MGCGRRWGWLEREVCRAVLEWWGVFEVLSRGRLHQIPSSDFLKLWLFHLVDEVVMAANERIAFHSRVFNEYAAVPAIYVLELRLMNVI